MRCGMPQACALMFELPLRQQCTAGGASSETTETFREGTTFTKATYDGSVHWHKAWGPRQSWCKDVEHAKIFLIANPNEN